MRLESCYKVFKNKRCLHKSGTKGLDGKESLLCFPMLNICLHAAYLRPNFKKALNYNSHWKVKGLQEICIP